VLEGCSQAGHRGVMEGLMEPYVKAAVSHAMRANPALSAYSVGSIEDASVAMTEGGPKKKVKKLTLSGGAFGAGGGAAGGWGA